MAEKKCDRCGCPLSGRRERARITLSLRERPREVEYTFVLCSRCADEVSRSFHADPLRKLTLEDALAKAATTGEDDASVDLEQWPRPARVDHVHLGGPDEEREKP